MIIKTFRPTPLDFKTSKQTFIRLILMFTVLINTVNPVLAQNADFTATTSGACSPVNVELADNSTGAVSWEWDLGNSNITNSQYPSLNYVIPGAYTVQLTINGGGSSNLVKSQVIPVYPAPNPVIPISVGGCEPFSGLLIAEAIPVTTVPFSIGSTLVGSITGGATVSYTWNFAGAIPTVTQASPVLTLTNIPAGSYDVLLTVTDEHGCISSIYKQNVIDVKPKPIADFKVTKSNICALGSVNFTNESTISSGNIVSYAWDLNNDGTIESTQKDFQHTYTLEGTYEIGLTVVSDEGCVSDKTVKEVSFNSDNSIDFSFSGSCANKAVEFTDLSSSNAIKWEWDFDENGTIDDTIPNPTYTYPTAGTYIAKLTSTFSDGCKMETSKSIEISDLNANFTFDTSVNCAPSYTLLFNSTSTASGISNITTYTWDFDNDDAGDAFTENTSYSFNNAGTFPVRLIVGNAEGCTDTISQDVVIADAGLNFSTTVFEGCAPLSTSFSTLYSYAADPIVIYSWDFGDPISGANNNSTLANPSHIFSDLGEYDITLTATTAMGCVLVSSKEKHIKVGIPKTIGSLNVIQTDSCLKTPVDFEATFDQDVTKLVWDFMDGTPPQEQDVTGGSATITYTYPKPDTHSVSVTAWCNGCPALVPLSQGGIVINEPKADFTASNTSVCSVPTTISFTNTSISDRAVTTWEWDFGDGTAISTDENPTHEYLTTGDYEVNLKAYNSTTKCENESKVKIYVNTSNPDFSADNTSVCVGTEVEFTNDVATSSSPNFVVSQYNWNFGDGKTSTLPNPIHLYTTPGLYTVSLNVIGAQGCNTYINKVDYINVRGPIVDFTKDKALICEGASIAFTDATTKAVSDNADPALNNYTWDFGDGFTSGDKNPTHAYTTNGKFEVKLTVRDNNGCENSKTMTDSISVLPIKAGFTSTRASYCIDSLNSVQFTNTSQGTIVSYDWDLDGDGTYELIDTTAFQERTFLATGVFEIKQRVKNALGCESEFSKTITIVDGNAAFTHSNPSNNCAPVSIEFKSSDDASAVQSYLWKFGDGVTSTLANPSHDYLKPGDYNVSLTEVLVGGCSKESSDIVHIGGPSGTLNYSNASGCAPYTASFVAGKLAGGASELIWDFGDGNTLTEAILPTDTSRSTSYTYSTYGSRLPILILRDPSCGAYSYFQPTKRINTTEPPTADFTDSRAGYTCENLSIQFTDASVKVDPRYEINSWEWDFGDGSATVTGISNPLHTYTTAGTYTVTLTVNNGVVPGACESTVSKSIVVNPIPTVSITNAAIGQNDTIYTGVRSKDIVLSSDVVGSTFDWVRTNPAGIESTQPLFGNVDPLTNTIPGEVFQNTTENDISIIYTISPTGPSNTFCNGSPIYDTITVIPNPKISLLKYSDRPTLNNDATFNLKYTLHLINTSEEPVYSVQVTENFNDVFDGTGCDFKINGVLASGSLLANSLFDGVNNTKLLMEGQTLASLQQDSIIILLTVDTHKQKEIIPVFNQAELTGTFLSNSISVASDADPLTVDFEPTQTDIPVIELFIPDAFSPNKDGINEYYVISHTDLVKIELEVFNRWGNSVYKSTDYQNNWDGTGMGNFLGKDLPSGTYYCVYTVINNDNGEAIGKGVKYITLRR